MLELSTKQKRILLFMIGCVGTRALFVLISKNASPFLLPYLGFLALIPAMGFFLIYFTGSRTTGAEVFGDRIWWNNLRPIHGIMYTLFAYNAMIGNTNAWIYLLVDLVIGLSSFIWFHLLH